VKRGKAYTELDAAIPLALLPVRLETRYLGRGAEQVLGIRIFPDTIHADDHRTGLLEREVDAGRRYWEWTWGTVDAAVVTEARTWLAKQVGPHRAVYVAERLTPTNLAVSKGSADDAPVFPVVKPDATASPVVARLLPDEWMVRIYNGAGALVFEEFYALRDPEVVMAPSLVAGHDTTVEDPRGAVRGFLADQDLAWTLDFEAAVERGMAMSIPVASLPPKISTLLVTGVRIDRTPVDEADALFDQLDVHRYTRGLDLVPQGTPTNNTDAGRSGVSLDAPDIDAIFADAAKTGPRAVRALAEQLIQQPSSIYVARGADAVSLALGKVAPNAVDRTRHAHVADGSAAWAMNVGIGYATLGGFLGGPSWVSPGTPSTDDATVTELRDWYTAWVRGGAALPTIRCGEQPYGVLPISGRPTTAKVLLTFRRGLEHYLAQLLDLWIDALPAPTLDPDATDGRPATTADDEIADVASVLGAVPHPTALQLRNAYNYGPIDDERLAFFIDNIDGYLADTSDPEFTEVQLNRASRACLDAWNLRRAAIDSRGSNNPTIDAQYAAAVQFQSDLDDLEERWHEVFAAPLGNTRAVVEQQILPLLLDTLEGTDALPPVLDVLHGRGGVGSDDRLRLASTWYSSLPDGIHDLVAVDEDEATLLVPMVRWFLDVQFQLRQLTESGALDQRTAQAEHGPLLAHLLDITYQNAPTDQLLKVGIAFTVLGRILDLASAVTAPGSPDDVPDGDGEGEDGSQPGVETNPFGGEVLPESEVVALLERLLRESLGLAMYRLDAWVLSLSNEQFATRRKARPDGISIGAYGWLVDLEPSDDRASQGFIHAPSLNHATTAAVLRAGWSAFGTSAADAPLSVDLSSDRVRRAQWILDGLRNGQDLAEVLGARFERLLHDAHLDACIDDVRCAVLEATGQPGPPNSIVDGLVVARSAGSDRTQREQAVADAIAAAKAEPGADLASWNGVEAAARTVNAELDSVADVVLLQSVHSLLLGDTASAGAATAIASGVDASIPPITGTASQRDGQRVAHRVVALFAPSSSPPSAGPAAAASPDVVAWVESLLPTPAHVAFGWTPASTGTSERLDLDDLGLDIVDAMLLAGDSASQVGSDLCRVVGVLAAGVRGGPGTVDPAGGATVPTEVSLDEFGLQASRLVDALGRTRHLRAADLVTPDIDVAGDRYDLAELQRRGAAATTALGRLHTAIAEGNAADRRRALAKATAIGVPGALAVLELTLTDPVDESRLDAVLAALDERVSASPFATGPTSRMGAAEVADATADALRLLLGKRLPVTVRFEPAADLTASASAGPLAQAVADAGVTWLRQVARVRPAVGALEEALLLTHVTGGTVTSLAAVQLPSPALPWVATGLPASSSDQLSAVSVTGLADLTSDASSVGGLLIDSWGETIPRKDRATGIAVHFDAPSARPPQAILLSTVPEGDEYTTDGLADQLLFTLDLAKVRTLGPIDLGLGQFLPAVFLPSDLRLSDDLPPQEAAS
jgi:hypothetical protein